MDKENSEKQKGIEFLKYKIAENEKKAKTLEEEIADQNNILTLINESNLDIIYNNRELIIRDYSLADDFHIEGRRCSEGCHFYEQIQFIYTLKTPQGTFELKCKHLDDWTYDRKRFVLCQDDMGFGFEYSNLDDLYNFYTKQGVKKELLDRFMIDAKSKQEEYKNRSVEEDETEDGS